MWKVGHSKPLVQAKLRCFNTEKYIEPGQSKNTCFQVFGMHLVSSKLMIELIDKQSYFDAPNSSRCIVDKSMFFYCRMFANVKISIILHRLIWMISVYFAFSRLEIACRKSRSRLWETNDQPNTFKGRTHAFFLKFMFQEKRQNLNSKEYKVRSFIVNNTICETTSKRPNEWMKTTLNFFSKQMLES